jgi:hypothetical protein
MYISYNDIISRISQKPKWWLYGVPRYDDFSPKNATVYGKEVALVHTKCQACRHRYDVAIVGTSKAKSLRYVCEIYASLDIGDPPDACCSSTSMQSVEIEILQYWERGRDSERFNWIRDQQMEKPLAAYLSFDSEPPRDDVPEPWIDRLIRLNLVKEWDEAYAAKDINGQIDVLERASFIYSKEIVLLFQSDEIFYDEARASCSNLFD